jgi:predicted Zn-dependent protease
MLSWIKWGMVCALILSGVYVSLERIRTPKDRTYETLFQILGKPFKTLDRALTKIQGIDEEDEKRLGALILAEISQDSTVSQDVIIYIQSLLDKMSAHYNPKSLTWRVFVDKGPPNAYALPGGIIHVSLSLLNMLDSEDEIIAVLAHEKGHIDLGHCLDSYRREAKKRSLEGSLFPKLLPFFLKLQYSKYAEDEADRYAFEMIISLHYDPMALGKSFQTLLKCHPEEGESHILKDYLRSHPSLSIRREHWLEVGKQYLRDHPQSASNPRENLLRKKPVKNEEALSL